MAVKSGCHCQAFDLYTAQKRQGKHKRKEEELKKEMEEEEWKKTQTVGLIQEDMSQNDKGTEMMKMGMMKESLDTLDSEAENLNLILNEKKDQNDMSSEQTLMDANCYEKNKIEICWNMEERAAEKYRMPKHWKVSDMDY